MHYPTGRSVCEAWPTMVFSMNMNPNRDRPGSANARCCARLGVQPLIVRSPVRALLCCLLLALLAGCGQTETTAKSADHKSAAADETSAVSAPLVKVTPIKPVRKTLVRWTEQPGQIEAFEETPLYAKLAGYVEKMYVDIGDSITGPQFDEQGKLIHEGQLLAELSIPELDEEFQQKEAAVGQARAELAQAGAAVKVAKAAEASARARVEESESVVEQTQADYDFA